VKNALTVLVCLFGMAALMRAIRGNEHWVLTAQAQSDGTTIRVRHSGSGLPAYTVVVHGYSLGRDIAPLVIDSEGPGLPLGMTRTFEDTTVLPGRCTLQVGPLTLDVMEARLTVNGEDCRPGGEITVQVPPPPLSPRLK
jgi:hypothetical protein